MIEQPIYLDHHAHALLDPRVAVFLAEAFLHYDANPHSTHLAGERAYRAVELAREQVAGLIGASPAEIIFTSGATEANNLAIQGIAAHLAAAGRPRILVGAGEHLSILAAAEKSSPSTVARIPLDASGTVDIDVLGAMLGPDVGLVSIAAANHEIGTVQPIGTISTMVRAAGALLHSDLAQAAPWLPIDSSALDLASLSSHKMAGPVGVGALFVRRRLRRGLAAIQVGGGQEQALRPGSLPAPLCMAFGEACRLVQGERSSDVGRVARLRDVLHAHVATLGGIQLNGGANRLPNNLNLSFDGVDGEALVLRLRPVVSVSTGSACTSTSLEPSHVLKAIGLGDRRAESALRFGLGRCTTDADIALAGDAIVGAVQALRSLARRVA